MAEPTVSAGYAGNLMQFAVSKGASAAMLAERSGIAPGDLADPDNRVPMARYIALMKAAKHLCDAPALALDLGAEKDFKEISVVGLICYASPTMGAALMELNRFGRLTAEVDMSISGARFQLTPIDGALWLVDIRSDPNAFPEMTEATWSRFISETTRHFPDAPFAKAVHVTHEAPGHAADYERVLKVPVTFGSDRNAIMIDPSWLSIELHQPNRYVFGVLSEHADRLLESLEKTTTMRGRVESLAIPLLHTGDLNMDDIARQIGMSRQSLYRRLKQEDVSFETLIDDLRHRMALHYLGGKKASVNETAYLVGFSDPSSFSRAFKRWTGSSPRGWKTG
jgi:AraC-like DNA-binding protein